MRFIGITGIPDPLLQNAIATEGAIVAGRSPWQRLRFMVSEQRTLFRCEFWNTILIIFCSRYFLYELVIKMALIPIF